MKSVQLSLGNNESSDDRVVKKREDWLVMRRIRPARIGLSYYFIATTGSSFAARLAGTRLASMQTTIATAAMIRKSL